MKISREKKALVLFFALALCGLLGAYFYITGIGHSWNVAASAIDDMSGELQGYTAILYEGTAEKKSTTDSTESEKVLSLNSNSSQQQTQVEGEVTASQAITEEEQQEGKDVFDIQSLKRAYAAKGASVFELDLKNLSLYYNSTIIEAGNHTYGVFSVDEGHATTEYIKERISFYKKAKVDIIVCVCTSFSLIKDYADISLAISATDEKLHSGGVYSDGTFYNDASEIGQIGTILVSPSKVISAKDTKNL